MQPNVLDLIILMVRRLRIGIALKDLRAEDFNNYNRSEVSAAFSWVLQKVESGELKTEQSGSSGRDLRILHSAERMVITTEAYGYLIELYNIGILDFHDLEQIIEQAMMSNNFEKVGLPKMKEMIQKQVFSNERPGKIGRINLSGNETIN